MKRLTLGLTFTLLAASLAFAAPAPSPGSSPPLAAVAGDCGDPVEQLLAAGPALCSDPGLTVLSPAPERLPAAVTIHCCSQFQIDLCRQQCKDMDCKASIGCRAGECACTCNC